MKLIRAKLFLVVLLHTINCLLLTTPSMGLSCEQPLAMISQSSPLPTSQTSPATLLLVSNAPASLYFLKILKI